MSKLNLMLLYVERRIYEHQTEEGFIYLQPPVSNPRAGTEGELMGLAAFRREQTLDCSLEQKVAKLRNIVSSA